MIIYYYVLLCQTVVSALEKYKSEMGNFEKRGISQYRVAKWHLIWDLKELGDQFWMFEGRAFEAEETEKTKAWGQEHAWNSKKDGVVVAEWESREEGWSEGLPAHFEDLHVYSEWDGTPLDCSRGITRLIMYSHFKLLRHAVMFCLQNKQ